MPALSQLNYGRIFGAVTDQSGGSIVGATVTILDVERGVSRPLTTDSAGQYSAPSLIPGTYTIRVEFMGFKVVERADVVVGVGRDIRVDIALQPGDQTQTVTVTGEAPQINTTNAQLGGTIENQAVSDLPVSGRTYTGLLSYKPGLVARPGVTANAYMADGGRPQGTVWMLDGLYDVNAYHGATGNLGGQGGASVELSNFLPIDAIQEVNVIENPKAEYGWKPGAQVNVGLKSGTNSIHGSAVGFGSDAALDAKNPFLSAAQPKATATLEQFGGTIGGPIKKDKLFYFASYEGQRYTVGAPHLFQEPTSAPGLGASTSFPDAIAGLGSHGITPNTLSLKLAGCTATGVCNAANGLFQNSGSSINVAASPNSFGDVDNGVGKIDFHINEHNSVNGEYYIGDGKFVAPFAGATEFPQEYWATGATNLTEVVRGIWDWIPNSNWVNEARFGLDHVYSSLFADDCTPGSLGAPDYSKLGFVSGAPDCGFPQVTINGFTNLGGYKSDQPITFNTWAFSDSVSYTRGKHLFKFGAELHITTLNGGQFTFGKGAITFGGPQVTASFTGETPLEFFLAGTPSSGNLLLGNPLRNIRLQQYAGFIQDDWRVTPRLTLNLGFRYEAVPPVTEANNLFGNFDPNAPTGLIQQSSGNPAYNGAYDNFEPRFGLAWDVTGKGTTVVRAGAGITYGVYPLLDLIGSSQGATLNNIPTGFKLVAANGTVIPSPGTQQTGSLTLAPAQLQWIAGQPVFNSSAGSLACGNGVKPNPASCGINAIDQNFKLTRVFTWSVGVQHAFNNNLSMDISYVGNHGNQSGIVDANAATPGPATTSTASTSPLLNEQIRRSYYSQFPYLSTIQYLTNDEYSNYNSLQASLSQRVSHGLYFSVGYTYSHALDMGSDELMDQLLMDARHPRLDYGDAGFDARHSLTVVWTYAIPGVKSPGQLLEGWQINSAMTFLTAFPWAAVDSTDDVSGTGDLQDRWTLVGNPGDFKVGGLSTVPCYGVAGSTFGSTKGCTVVAAGPTATPWINMPQACIAAATAEPINSGVPAGSTGATGQLQLARLGCYMQGSSVIVPPAQGTFGTMTRDELRSSIPFYNWDFSIFKSWKFKERLTAQFRAEVFNLINHPQYQDQGQGSGNTSSLGSPGSFGNAQAEAGAPSITGTGLPRRIQLGLKLIF
ncbi:MAG TPA: TonB-dependent receptor [Candidatus Acidoferrales bacterium]|nr:TonB-dependent receptor [Candidatus Acidoferrales bacterium]